MYLRITAGLCALVALCVFVFTATPPEFERGEWAGLAYTCRYAADMHEGRLIIDRSLCVGRLADGRYFERDGEIVTIGDYRDG